MYSAIHDRPKKTNYLAVGVAAGCCVLLAGLYFSSGSSNELALAPARTGSVQCRNVRAHAGMDRRTALGGLFGVAALSGARAASAYRAPDLIDDRPAREKGFDIIYEARDLSLDQDTRDGFTQTRKGLAATKARVSSAEKKLSEAGSYVDKKYWTEGRNVLRRLVGTLRFDLATLADTKSGAAKKEAIKANKEFFASLESLDLAMYKKNPEAGKKAFGKTMAAYKDAVKLY